MSPCRAGGYQSSRSGVDSAESELEDGVEARPLPTSPYYTTSCSLPPPPTPRAALIPGGRLAYFYSTTSPLTLLASPAQLAQAQKDVEYYDGKIREVGNKGLWVDKATKEKYDDAKQCE